MNIFILSKNMIKIHIRINFILFSNLGQKISYPKNSKLSLKNIPQLLLSILHKISMLQKVSRSSIEIHKFVHTVYR